VPSFSAQTQDVSRLGGQLRFLFGLLLLFFATAAFVVFTAAQNRKPEEYQVKAVYLYNFGRFADWPVSEPKDDTFSICVLGTDPFGRELDDVAAGEQIDGKKLSVRRVATVREVGGCRILFISDSESSRIKDIIASLGKLPLLTVSDIRGFVDDGGMIEFVIVDNKVRFQVNLTAAQEAGLTLSSQLLRVATVVRGSANQ